MLFFEKVEFFSVYLKRFLCHLHVKETALETNIDHFLLSQGFFIPLMAAKQY